MPAVLLTGLLTALLTGRGGNLANVYEDEGYPDTLTSETEPSSVLHGTGLQDRTPERIPTAPPVVTQPPKSSLRLFCSPSAKHLFGNTLERAFEQVHPQIDMVLLEDKDRACIGNVIMRNTDAAIVGVPLSANEIKHAPMVKVLGHHIVIAIVHRDNTITSVFTDPLRRVLDGRIGNWRELGWQNLQVQPVYQGPGGRDDLAARLLQMTGKAAQLAVLLPDGDRVMDYVSRERRALGLVTLSQLQSRRGVVRYLEINTVPPTVANYLRGAYSLGCTFRMIYIREQRSRLAELLEFLDGNAGRQLLEPHLSLP